MLLVAFSKSDVFVVGDDAVILIVDYEEVESIEISRVTGRGWDTSEINYTVAIMSFSKILIGLSELLVIQITISWVPGERCNVVDDFDLYNGDIIIEVNVGKVTAVPVSMDVLIDD